MSAEKPLNVRVAEALGWTVCFRLVMQWIGNVPETGTQEPIPSYDTDWDVTGPLIERLGLALTPPAVVPSGQWYASLPPTSGLVEKAPAATPLRSVCYLILALAAAGKLPK